MRMRMHFVYFNWTKEIQIEFIFHNANVATAAATENVANAKFWFGKFFNVKSAFNQVVPKRTNLH